MLSFWLALLVPYIHNACLLPQLCYCFQSLIFFQAQVRSSDFSLCLHIQGNIYTLFVLCTVNHTNIVLSLSGGWYVYQQRNEVHNNCGIEIYYQTDMQTTHDNMLLELFCQIISEPCFNTLRTKEQLGMPTKHKQRMQNTLCGPSSNTVFNILYIKPKLRQLYLCFALSGEYLSWDLAHC